MVESSKEKKLIINTIIIFFSKVCTQILSILILPLITNKLSTNDYGTFDLITVYALFITAFMGLNIENGVFRYLIEARENEEQKKNIISSGFISMFFFTTVFTIAYFLIWKILKFENSTSIYIFAISSLYFNLFLQITRGLGDNLSYGIASIIVGVTNIVLSFIFLYVLNLGLLGLVYAAIISYLIGCYFIFIKKKVYKYLSIKFLNKSFTLKIIKYSIPLVPNNISSWIMNISDKVMLSFFINNSANGIYSIATKFPMLLSHVYGVINLSWTESASVNAKEQDRDSFFTNVINRVFILCFCLCMMTLSLMAIIFRIMINIEYFSAYYYIPILILASTFEIISGLLGGIYISLMKTKKIAITTVVAGIVNGLINILFISKIGIWAACISTAVSYFLLAIYRYFDVKKYVNVKMNYKTILFLYLIFGFISWLYMYNSVILSILSFIISVIVSIFVNYDVLVKMFNSLNKKIKNKKYK